MASSGTFLSTTAGTFSFGNAAPQRLQVTTSGLRIDQLSGSSASGASHPGHRQKRSPACSGTSFASALGSIARRAFASGVAQNRASHSGGRASPARGLAGGRSAPATARAVPSPSAIKAARRAIDRDWL